MRTSKLLIYFLCISTFIVTAQENKGYYVEIGSAIGLVSLNDSEYELSTRDLVVAPGYDFSKRFTIKSPLILSTGLFEHGEHNTKTYETTGTIGVGLGYNFVVKPSYRLQLSGELGDTFFNKKDEWGYFYYDAGCKLYLGKFTDKANAIVGLGVKQMFSEGKYTTNFVVPYLNIGFRLSAGKKSSSR